MNLREALSINLKKKRIFMLINLNCFNKFLQVLFIMQVITMINILEVEKQRENFIKNNDIPKSVRPEILNSWIRCKHYNVDTNN